MEPTEKYPLEKVTSKTIFLKNFITNPNIEVGDYTYYSDQNHPELFEQNNVVFGYFSKLIIGKFCQIAEGTKFVLSDANHQLDAFSTYPFFIFGKHNGACPKWGNYEPHLPDRGPTIVGNDVWLGHESMLLPGVEIGDGAIIGARAVVTKSVEPYSIVVGNPARVIRKRFDDKTIKELLAIRWWNWDFEKISAHISAIVSADIKKLKK